MRVYSIAVLILLLSFYVSAQSQPNTASEEKSLLRTHALKINVDDMKKAVAFYAGKLGFEIEDKTNYPNQVVLKTDDRIKLVLNKAKHLRKSSPADTGVVLTLQVNDLDQAIEKMRKAGIEFAETERRKEGVGYAISIRDPFGRNISMMHETIVKNAPFREPRLYNFGVSLPNMETGRDFYSNKLGFVVRSERYLPLDLPLGHKDKTFGFMLHVRPNVQPITSLYPKEMPFYTMVFETSDLQKFADEMKSRNIKIVDKKTLKNGKLETVVIEDPFGNISEIIEAN